jgi:glycosyltransferase involved in cell wall biosynthesis
LKKNTIVISGINVTNSGILSIMTDCLTELVDYSKDKNLRIIALVNSKSLFSIPTIEYIEFPKSKKSWFYRMYYEYFYFKKLSENLDANIWFSIQDLSPKVKANKKFVYCHNPSPFYKPNLHDWIYGFRISFFAWFYKYAYRFNIQSNTAVFVQQNWIKKQFEDWFKISNVKVSYPETRTINSIKTVELNKEKNIFFYPCFPRMFKNIGFICDAILLLPKELRDTISVYFTINGTENSYSKKITSTYKNHSEFKFIGALDRTTVAGYYNQMGALLFPSKLETWGLPLTETKEFNKPIFVSNLPYAHETVGVYDKVCFFDLNDPKDLANKIQLFVENKIVFSPTTKNDVNKPDFVGWKPLFDFIFTE